MQSSRQPHRRVLSSNTNMSLNPAQEIPCPALTQPDQSHPCGPRGQGAKGPRGQGAKGPRGPVPYGPMGQWANGPRSQDGPAQTNLIQMEIESPTLVRDGRESSRVESSRVESELGVKSSQSRL